MIRSTDKGFWIKNLRQQERDNAHIGSLDPLGIDQVIKRLPKLNARQDVVQIIKDLYRHLPVPNKLTRYNTAEALACMRDIGFYLGSIKRHGLEPVEEVPELDYILDVLSSKTDMPPRDTLLHYTQWNPKGERLRTYTHYQDEIELINSVQVAMMPLMSAIYQLIDLYNTPVEHEEFALQCAMVRKNYNAVIEGIVIAKRNVSPELFAKELRLYFDPIVIYNKDFIGPGAVEMPLFVYDYLLWGADVRNAVYQRFSCTYLPFNLPQVRDVYYNFVDKNSLVTKMVKALEACSDDKQLLDNARALHSLCKLEKSFRIPHKKLADESYQHQPKASREVGSGGYATSILNDIFEENMKQINRLGEAIVQCVMV